MRLSFSKISVFAAAFVACGFVSSTANADTNYFNLAGGDFSQNWSNTSLITANDNWSNVPSITGFRGDGLTNANDVDARTVLADETTVDVNANQTNPNTFTTGGVTEFQIANPTIALTGSGTADAPFIVLYLNGTGRQTINLSLNLRDIDGSTDNAAQQIAVQYRTNAAAAFANAVNGYVADATTGPSLATLVTPLSVTLGADANNASTIQIRIITTNAASNDEWVGLDDIVVSSAPIVVVPEASTFALIAPVLGVLGVVVARRRKLA